MQRGSTLEKAVKAMNALVDIEKNTRKEIPKVKLVWIRTIINSVKIVNSTLAPLVLIDKYWRRGGRVLLASKCSEIVQILFQFVGHRFRPRDMDMNIIMSGLIHGGDVITPINYKDRNIVNTVHHVNSEILQISYTDVPFKTSNAKCCSMTSLKREKKSFWFAQALQLFHLSDWKMTKFSVSLNCCGFLRQHVLLIMMIVCLTVYSYGAQ